MGGRTFPPMTARTKKKGREAAAQAAVAVLMEEEERRRRREEGEEEEERLRSRLLSVFFLSLLLLPSLVSLGGERRLGLRDVYTHTHTPDPEALNLLSETCFTLQLH